MGARTIGLLAHSSLLRGGPIAPRSRVYDIYAIEIEP